MANVERVASYELVGINRVKFEEVIHRIFSPAQLNIEIVDRLGKAIHPREWFVVPLTAIEEAIGRIRDGSIKDYVYSPTEAKLVQVKGNE